MSKCTVASLCPYPINAFKPGLNPENYHIEEAGPGEIKLLVVEDSFYFRQIPLQTEQLRMPVSASEIARSIVQDHLQSLIYASPESRPALFWVEGEKTVAEIRKECADQIKEETSKQLLWYQTLVAKADDDWQKYRSLNTITKTQRKAAAALGAKRDWVTTDVTSTKECIACFSRIDKRATVCPVCTTPQVAVKEVKTA